MGLMLRRTGTQSGPGMRKGRGRSGSLRRRRIKATNSRIIDMPQRTRSIVMSRSKEKPRARAQQIPQAMTETQGEPVTEALGKDGWEKAVLSPWRAEAGCRRG